MAKSRFVREAPCKVKAVRTPVGRPFSFYDFREDYFHKDMDSLARLLSQVRRLGADIMYLERPTVSDCEDMIEENEDLRIRFDGTRVSSDIMRMSFFRGRASSLRQMQEKDFLGYIIVKTDYCGGKMLKRRVYESVLKISRPQNGFIRGAPIWRCRVQDRIFQIQGYLYAQQNFLTNVCAHVALRTCAASFHPEGDMTYREINRILGINHRKRWVGESRGRKRPSLGGGLDTRQMVEVMEKAGARCIDVDYDKRLPQKPAPPPPYEHYVYGSIESGFPAMLVFDTMEPEICHTVPVFGHTMNQDLWVPRAERHYFTVGPDTRFLLSDSWLASFIVHDDNWGSNFCCPKLFLKPLPHRKSGERAKRHPATHHEWLTRVIATLPQHVELNPVHAESYGADCLFAMLKQAPKDSPAWSKRLLQHQKKGMIVLRALLVSGSEYAAHLRSMRGWRQAQISARVTRALEEGLGADDKFWMIEFSIPELFATNLRKLGEVLLFSDHPYRGEDETQTYLDFVVFARLPGHYVIPPEQGARKDGKFQFIPSPISSHVRLFGLADKTKVVA